MPAPAPRPAAPAAHRCGVRMVGTITSRARSRTTSWFGIVYSIELAATPASLARAFTVRAPRPSRAISRQAAAITRASRSRMFFDLVATPHQSPAPQTVGSGVQVERRLATNLHEPQTLPEPGGGRIGVARPPLRHGVPSKGTSDAPRHSPDDEESRYSPRAAVAN